MRLTSLVPRVLSRTLGACALAAGTFWPATPPAAASVSLVPAHGAPLAAPDATPSPTITVYTSGVTPGFSAGESPVGIAPGANGTMWFTEVGNKPGVAAMSPAGVVHEHATGPSGATHPYAIVPGAGGTMWFTDTAKPAIWRVSPTGKLTSFQHGLSPGDAPAGLTRAADGTFWFVSTGAGSYVGHVSATGTIAEVARIPSALTADPSLAVDPSGNVWLTANDGTYAYLVKVTPAGAVTATQLVLQVGANPCCVYESPQAFATRADGSVWFTNLFYVGPKNGSHPLGIIANGSVRFVYDTKASYIGSVSAGLRNELWFDDQDPFFVAPSFGRVYPSGQLHARVSLSKLLPVSIAQSSTGDVWMAGVDGNLNGALIRARY